MNDEEIRDFSPLHYAASQQAYAPESPQLAQQMEGFAVATRTLEQNLARERNYSKQLRDYANKLGAHIQKVAQCEAQLRSQVQAFQKRDAWSTENIKSLNAELLRTREELVKYRKSYEDIKKREQQAAAVLEEVASNRRQIDELQDELRSIHESWLLEKSKHEETAAYAKKYRNEVQDALSRVHIAEAKFTEATKELQIQEQSRRAREQELIQIEQACRERFELQVAKEKERLKIESEIAIEEIRIQSQAEIQKIRTQCQVEADQASQREVERIKADLMKYFVDERRKSDDEYSKTLYQKEEVIQDLKSRLSKSSKHTDELLLKQCSLQEDLGIKEKRISWLKAECQLLQDALMSEKARIGQLADQIEEELSGHEQLVLDSAAVIDALRETAQIHTVAAENPAKPPLPPMPRARMDC